MHSRRRTKLAALAASLAIASLLLIGCVPPPTGISATAGDRSATVKFLAHDPGPGFTMEYEVRSLPGDRVVLVRDPRRSASATVSGLDNGTEYRFVVRSRRSSDPRDVWGAWSEPTAPVVPRGKPAAPTISRVAGFVDLETGCTARVTFTPGSNGGQPISRYEVTVSGDSAPVSGSSSPIEVRGLTPHTSYGFTVKAFNASGASPASATFTGSCS